jgi:hypothetical protein
MRNSKTIDANNVSHAERAKSSALAKKALLEKFKAKAADPAMEQRQAEMIAVAEAREARKAERDAKKRELQAQKAAEEARKEAEREAERQAQAAQAALEAEQQAALLAAQKAARDERYAKRKARK